MAASTPQELGMANRMAHSTGWQRQAPACRWLLRMGQTIGKLRCTPLAAATRMARVFSRTRGSRTTGKHRRRTQRLGPAHRRDHVAQPPSAGSQKHPRGRGGHIPGLWTPDIWSSVSWFDPFSLVPRSISQYHCPCPFQRRTHRMLKCLWFGEMDITCMSEPPWHLRTAYEGNHLARHRLLSCLAWALWQGV